MNYRVHWTPAALQDLADLWVNSLDRNAVRTAADQIDAVLERDPLGQGESRHERTRFLFVPPLAVFYDVDEAARLVTVWAVWRPRKRS
jgi:plasmid stabilization system protein ParE